MQARDLAKAPAAARSSALAETDAFKRVAADPFANQSTYTRMLAANARRLTALADKLGGPTAWDSAAVEWDRVLLDTAGGPLEDETRYQVARARYMAWRAEANEKRTTRATAALEAYLARVTAGPRHDEAKGWIEQVKK